MNEKRTYETKLRARLQQRATEIEILQARVELADTDLRVAAEDKVTELRARHKLAREKLGALRATCGGPWKHLKIDASAAANSLDHALRSVRAAI